jgi:hypothetical protein
MATELLKRRPVPSSMICWAIVAGFVLFTFSFLEQATAEIINGGFETAENVNQPIFDHIEGWSVIWGASSAMLRQNGQASEGLNYVDLNVSIEGYWQTSTIQLCSDFSIAPAPTETFISFDYYFRIDRDSWYPPIYSAHVQLGTDQGEIPNNILQYSIPLREYPWRAYNVSIPPNTEVKSMTIFFAADHSNWQSSGSAWFAIDNVHVTPEPSTIALLVFGLGGLPVIAWQRWSDKKKAKGGE